MPRLCATTRGVKRRPAWPGVRYAAELAIGVMLVCVAWHTFFVAGLIVPVAVSGGSMAETLLGPRCEVVCPRCGHEFACGLERLRADGLALCLNCGFDHVSLDTGRDLPGERMLIDRRAYDFRSPARWETAVFRSPEQADSFWVKRIVGLPGESIEIRHGDIYVSGKIARKSLAQCRELSQLVFDANYAPDPPADSAPRWRELGDQNRWQETSTGTFRCDNKQPVVRDQDSPATSELTWLAFQPLDGRWVNDDSGYNPGDSRRLNPVRDLMLRARITATSPGMVALRTDDGRDAFTIELSLTGETLRLRRAGEALLQTSFPAAALRTGAQVELVRFDDQVWLAIDGEVILQFPFEPTEAAPGRNPPESAPLAIGASSLALQVDSLQVLRDVYYTHPQASPPVWGVNRAAELGATEYFVLGDNSPISADSRLLRKPGIPFDLLIGRPLATW